MRSIFPKMSPARSCEHPVIAADLHMHSTASDGVLEAQEILERAQGLDLKAIAITDHDALDGARAARCAAADVAVEVIAGVEISTQTDGRDVHMLGYFIDLDDEALESFFLENRLHREQRACAIADNMAADGYSVSSELMHATGQTLNRALLARLLVESGEARSIDDAFARLIGESSPYYVDNSYPASVEAIELINAAGGSAFIAHPAHYHVVDLIAPLAREGLTGVEAYHTMQTAAQSAELVAIAEELGLGVSGGSDWHGDATHHARLGGAGLSEEAFADFCRACGVTFDMSQHYLER